MIPSQAGTSASAISVIDLLSKKVLGKFFSKVSQISLSYSFAQIVVNPADQTQDPARLLQKTKTLYSSWFLWDLVDLSLKTPALTDKECHQKTAFFHVFLFASVAKN